MCNIKLNNLLHKLYQPFTWCYNCAYYSIKNKNKYYKIFAYEFIQYAKAHESFINDNTEWELDNNRVRMIITSNVLENWDLDFFEKDKWKAKYYKFFEMLIKDHIVRAGFSLSKGFKVYFNNKNKSLIIEKNIRWL